MSDLVDLSDTPTLFLVPVTLIGVLLVALPAVVIGRLLRDRTRRRTWTTTRARLLATRTETHHRSGDHPHGRTRTVGRWEYRDTNGTPRTGEGDIDGVWLSGDGASQDLDVLVDPTDQGRSQARTAPPGAAAVLVSPVLGFVGVIGVVLLLAVLAALLD